MYKIGIKYQFESGHYLTGLPDTHKCTRPHGHNYVLQVEFESETLDATGLFSTISTLNLSKITSTQSGIIGCSMICWTLTQPWKIW